MKAERPYWSFSRLSGYSCSQLGYYQYERKLRKKGEPFFALKAGQDGHEALHLVLAEGVSPSDAVESVMGAEQVQGLFSQESDNITPHQMESIIQDYVDTVMGGPYRPVQLSADMMQMDKLVWPTPVEIEEIYGVRQQGEIVIFSSHNPEALEIQLAGDFNDWMPHTTPMRRMGRGDFEARLRLPKGRYRYRLVIDGHWSHDLHNPRVETNEYGELNSIVEIPV